VLPHPDGPTSISSSPMRASKLTSLSTSVRDSPWPKPLHTVLVLTAMLFICFSLRVLFYPVFGKVKIALRYYASAVERNGGFKRAAVRNAQRRGELADERDGPKRDERQLPRQEERRHRFLDAHPAEKSREPDAAAVADQPDSQSLHHDHP